MAKEHTHPNGYGHEFWCSQQRCLDAMDTALKQQAESEYDSLAEMVEALEVGTIFEDTDDLGRKHEMMRVWRGVIINNGIGERPFNYGDKWDDGYSIEVTHRASRPITEEVTYGRQL